MCHDKNKGKKNLCRSRDKVSAKSWVREWKTIVFFINISFSFFGKHNFPRAEPAKEREKLILCHKNKQMFVVCLPFIPTRFYDGILKGPAKGVREGGLKDIF